MSGRTIFSAALLGALILLVSNRGFGQSDPQKAYCEYIQQRALLQATLLRSPEAIAGISQPNSDTASQMYWGISSSFGGFSKAKLTLEAARKDCQSYRATSEVALRIQYDQARLEQEALRHRSELLQHAIEQLDLIIARNVQVLEVQNLTRPMLYSLQSIRTRLVHRTNSSLYYRPPRL